MLANLPLGVSVPGIFPFPRPAPDNPIGMSDNLARPARVTIKWALAGGCDGLAMIGLEIDDYILPSERRVLRVRGHWAMLLRDFAESALALVVLMLLDAYLPSSLVVDTLTWYGGLVVVARLTI